MKNRSAKLSERGQISTISLCNSRSITQESDGIWTVPTVLQPISFKSDRLLESSLVRCWYARRGWCLILIPLSLIFAALTWLRRRLYDLGWLPSRPMPVPVIVVGNLTAGGAGKTPLTIWLVERLQAGGYRPGVVSRGYGAAVTGVREVGPDGDPMLLGDEPVLLARRTHCPVWVGRRRAEVARRLLTSHPEVNVIVADDGLQHYALARDVEIVVVDGRRGFGNTWRLPAGPLREGLSRLRQVDAVVVNGDGRLAELAGPIFTMALDGQDFYSLHDASHKESADFFRGRQVHALAGIGNPERFFDTLTGLGLTIVRHSFPDHHAYRQEDLPKGTVIMTEKDAVKCAAYGHPDAWVLAVNARLSDGLERLILDKLELKHGQQAA